MNNYAHKYNQTQIQSIDKKSMLKSILLSITIIFAVVYLYMGFHTQITIEETILPSKVILYKEYIGDYREMNKALKVLETELKELETTKYSEFGMFYDQPNQLEDPKQARAIIGAMIDPRERHIASKFLINHNHYRISEYNDQTCISAKFPYRNELSLAWVISKVYPALVEHGKSNNLFKKDNTVGSLEIYHFKNGESYIEIIFPYGENVQSLMLTRAPKPASLQKNQDL